MSCLSGAEIKAKPRRIFLASLLLIVVLNVTTVKCDLNLNKTNNENLTSPLMPCNDEEKCKAMVRDRMLLSQKFDDYLRESSSVLSSHHTERLKHSSVLYGLSVAAEENQLNQRCYNEIMQIYHGINRKEIWAMKSELRKKTFRNLSVSSHDKSSDHLSESLEMREVI